MQRRETRGATHAMADLSSNAPPLAVLAANLGAHNTWPRALQLGLPPRDYKGKGRVLPLGRNNPRHQYRLGLSCWRAALPRGTWECWGMTG